VKARVGALREPAVELVLEVEGVREAPRRLPALHARENVTPLGPPDTGKTHLAIALALRACQGGQGCRSGQRPSGSRCSPTLTAKARWTRNYVASSATRCWYAARLATTPSTHKPRTCCLCSSAGEVEVSAGLGGEGCGLHPRAIAPKQQVAPVPTNFWLTGGHAPFHACPPRQP